MKKAAAETAGLKTPPPLPAEGGSYTRNPDGSLSRDSAGSPAAEPPAEEA
jgi:hypothetical protein